MKTQNELLDLPSKAEHAAAVLSKSADTFIKGELVPTSLRVPAWIMAKLDALATHSGKSRNYVVNLVLDAGLDSILSNFEPETLEQLDFLARDALSTTRSRGQNVSGEI